MWTIMLNLRKLRFEDAGCENTTPFHCTCVVNITLRSNTDSSQF